MWSDRETPHDFLGFTSYVMALADVCLHPALAPLTLGVFGAWGSGKSSLMRMLRAEIDKRSKATPGDKRILALEFNAWRYEGRDEIQAALIHAIVAKLLEGQTLVDEAKAIFAKVKRNASVLKAAKLTAKAVLSKVVDIGDVVDALNVESEQLATMMQRFEREFSECLVAAKVERIVVFIDDLDRCSDAKVVETFETIKLFLNVPACTFVIGADDERIKECVGAVYGIHDATRRKDFLEKIIQIPFRIPGQTLADLRCFIGMLIIQKHATLDSEMSLCEARTEFYSSDDLVKYNTWLQSHRTLFAQDTDPVVQELRAILPYAGVIARGLRGNPRQIKRFLNILSLRKRLAELNTMSVDSGLLIKICVIQYVWDTFFLDLARTVDPSTGQSELLKALCEDSKESRESDSALVADWSAKAQLIEFLDAEPKLEATLDLRPYLFLAQTSLTGGQTRELLPADERSEELIAQIMDDDRVISRAGARRAAADDPAVAVSVVRGLCSRLKSGGNERANAHILSALLQIAIVHTSQFKVILKALDAFDPGKSDGLRLAATQILKMASDTNEEVPGTLKDKYESKLTRALVAPNRTMGARKK